MDQAERRGLMARYRDGSQDVRAAAAGVSAADLTAHPLADEWSIQEIVHHLTDSELIAANVVLRLVAEDQPNLPSYDEADYARRLHYPTRSVQSSLTALAAIRGSTADLLNQLDESEWQRAGTQSPGGQYSLEDWLRDYSVHAAEHAEQIRQVLQAVSRSRA